MISDVVVPGFGGTGGDVVIADWLVAPGDAVEAGQPLFLASTDKADVEVEAFRSGVVVELLAAAGSEVAIGDRVAVIADSLEEAGGAAAADEVAAAALQEPPYERLALDDEQLEAYRLMVLIRRYEDHLYALFLQGAVPGTLHQCQGQEAAAVGVCTALRRDDVVFSTHRPVGHLIAKGGALRPISAELWGKATGCAGGKGGQMHLVDVSVGYPPSNAIVGGNVPIATGAGLGFKLRGLDRVAVSFFGDGAANIGALHEGVNLAAVRDAPVLFVCENNLYGASTHQSLVTRVGDIAERAAGYGIPGEVVDGMDYPAVRAAADRAVARARAGEGPTLLELKTYRYKGHSRSDPGSYRRDRELEHWLERDPIPAFRATLLRGGVEEARLDEIEAACQAEVEDSVAFALRSPDPSPAAVTAHVYADRKDLR